MVYHTAYRMVANQADAEDIAQETFLKVYKKIKGFKHESSLGWWIKRIVIRTTLNHIEKKKKLNWVFIDEEFPISSNEFLNGEKNDEPETKISLQEIQDSVLKLPAGCRMVFNLFAFEGYTHDEISEILNISNSTSKTQYRRAKMLLQPMLKNKVNGGSI